MKPLILDKHIATHKIITFDVDNSGSMKPETIRIMYFSGTDKGASERAKQWRIQRDKEEPLGISEEWGELKYLAHVWRLDNRGEEVDYFSV